MTTPSRAAVAKRIDHTLLRPEATAAHIAELCLEAAEWGVAAVCVAPSRVALAAGVLQRLELTQVHGVAVASVVGFPSGAHVPQIKAAEAEEAVAEGATEIDMVIDLGAAADDDWAEVGRDIAAVRRAVPHPVLLKVIVESALLGPEGVVAGCRAADEAGADYVKTSTGLHPSGGADLEAVRLMAETVDGRLGVKASGGIRTAEAALAFLDAGATRLGLSATRAVLDELSG